MAYHTIGIIGGTGLADALAREANGEAIEVETPFGAPSAPIVCARWAGAEVLFLARHGLRHRFNPSGVPYRANIWALKSLGAQAVLASGATGSLREDVEPGQLVLCDQLIDRTTRRVGTFFDTGPVVHVEMSDPFCPHLRSVLIEAGGTVESTVHHAGTYVCMEGPQFSTRAESHLHRQWGGDLIGMTCQPEAKLAREAELCYALIAMVTDYDCWRPVVDGAPRETLLREIVQNLHDASQRAAALIRAALPRLVAGSEPDCGCRRSLDLAVWSDLASLDDAEKERIGLLLERRIAQVR